MDGSGMGYRYGYVRVQAGDSKTNSLIDIGPMAYLATSTICG